MARVHEGLWPPVPSAVSPTDREGGTSSAYEPDPLIGRPVTLSDDTVGYVAEVEQKIGELGDFGAGCERFFLRVEAIASSRVDWLLVSPYAVALAQLVELEPHVDALRVAVEELAHDAHVTVAGIDHVQRVLMAGEPHRQGVRADQTWIGGPGPVGAGYVPPPPQHVADLMTDLVGYLDNEEHPILVQAALAYGQLRLISPFRAGNGHVGRALAAAVMRRRGLTPSYVLPVSVPMYAMHDVTNRELKRAAYEGPASSEAAGEVTDQ